jgi:hypothetical protein
MAEDSAGSALEARLQAIERENRILRDEAYDLHRSLRRLRRVVWLVVALVVGEIVASHYWVLPWRRTTHYDRVIANRFEVPNRISPEYKFYHNTHDRPDAVFGWVSEGELRYGRWGGLDYERSEITVGQGPGLYVRRPKQTDVPTDKEEIKLGVLDRVASFP